MTTYEHLRIVREASDQELVDVALKLLATDPSLFLKLLRGEGVEVVIHGAKRLVISSHDIAQLRACGNLPSDKIPAIKLSRTLFSLSLKEAKDLVEELGFVGILSKAFARDGDYDYNSCVQVLS